MKINLNRIPITDKIKFFNQLYKDISGKGIGGDTELAHVNKYEACVLRALGGSGTINPSTNLTQYMGGGGGGQQQAPAPTSSTVKQVTELPEYFKPYAEEMLETSSELYNQPYEAFEGQRLADITPAQGAAYTGMETTYSQTDPTTGVVSYKSPTEAGYARAAEMTEAGSAQYGDLPAGEFESKYMSPYQQAVTDVQVRETQRKADIEGQQLAGEAAKAQAFGGSRHAVLEAERQRNLSRQLSDIQATGGQQAFTAGQASYAADRAAQHAGAQQLGTLTPASQLANLTGLGALQSLGETQRSISQQPLDINYEEFVREQDYPRKSVQEYGGIIQGFPMQPSTYTTSQQYQQAPSLGQNLLQAGALYGGIASGLGKAFGTKGGGYIPSYAGGGLTGLRFQSDGAVPTPKKAIDVWDYYNNPHAFRDFRGNYNPNQRAEDDAMLRLMRGRITRADINEQRSKRTPDFSPEQERLALNIDAVKSATVKELRDQYNIEYATDIMENRKKELGPDPATWERSIQDEYIALFNYRVSNLSPQRGGMQDPQFFPEMAALPSVTADVVREREADPDLTAQYPIDSGTEKTIEAPITDEVITTPTVVDDRFSTEDFKAPRPPVQQGEDRFYTPTEIRPDRRIETIIDVPPSDIPTARPSTDSGFTAQAGKYNPTLRESAWGEPYYAAGGLTGVRFANTGQVSLLDRIGRGAEGLGEGYADYQKIRDLFPEKELMNPDQMRSMIAKHKATNRGSLSPYQQQLLSNRLKGQSIKGIQHPEGSMSRLTDLLDVYHQYYPKETNTAKRQVSRTAHLASGGLTGLRFQSGGTGNWGQGAPKPQHPGTFPHGYKPYQPGPSTPEPWWRKAINRGAAAQTRIDATRAGYEGARKTAAAALPEHKVYDAGGGKAGSTYTAGEQPAKSSLFNRQAAIRDAGINLNNADDNVKRLKKMGVAKNSKEMQTALSQRTRAAQLFKGAKDARIGMFGRHAIGRIPRNLVGLAKRHPVILGLAALSAFGGDEEEEDKEISEEDIRSMALNTPPSEEYIVEEDIEVSPDKTGWSFNKMKNLPVYASGGLTGLRFKSEGNVEVPLTVDEIDALITEAEDLKYAEDKAEILSQFPEERATAREEFGIRESLPPVVDTAAVQKEKAKEKYEESRAKDIAEDAAIIGRTREDEISEIRSDVESFADLLDPSTWSLKGAVKAVIPQDWANIISRINHADDPAGEIVEMYGEGRLNAYDLEKMQATARQAKRDKHSAASLKILNDAIEKINKRETKVRSSIEHAEGLQSLMKQRAVAEKREAAEQERKDRPFFDMEAAAPWLTFAGKVGEPGQTFSTALSSGVAGFGEAKKAFSSIPTKDEKELLREATKAQIDLSRAQAELARSTPRTELDKLILAQNKFTIGEANKNLGVLLEQAVDRLEDPKVTGEEREALKISIKELTAALREASLTGGVKSASSPKLVQ